MAPGASSPVVAKATAGRRPYVPLARPGARDRWSSAAIVAALRAWTEELGAPPRRDDWSGAPAASAAGRKWMREHPRWPSSSCVAAHFGSWSAALQAAGLPARSLTFATTLPDRVQAARRLAAAGLRIGEIADELGVSASTVRNYLRARACPGCGGPLPSPEAGRCRDCTRHEPTVRRAWSRADVHGAIRDWCDEHAAPPRYRDWTPSRERPGRWERESPRWPSAAVVCALYSDTPDPWNAALRDAGEQERVRRWDDEAVRASLAGFWTREGRPPRAADLVSPAWSGPSRQTLQRRYGGLAAAWRRLGPAPQLEAGR